MTHRRRLAALLIAATRDIEAARRLLPDMPDQAIFHAQQAAEKLTRAVCEREGVAVGRTHDIGQAAAFLPDGRMFKADMLGLDTLSAAATAWRYPSPGGWFPAMPDPDAAAASLADIGCRESAIGSPSPDRRSHRQARRLRGRKPRTRAPSIPAPSQERLLLPCWHPVVRGLMRMPSIHFQSPRAYHVEWLLRRLNHVHLVRPT
ncbi:MAG: HEPN domain-containing protein [Alphaproteobacteria bacterium]|nr:HEPN domain-containing protein [Alphaproteobacteria bacterium]